MVNPEDIVTALKCVDGKSVVIDSTYIDRCQLFDSLPSQPDEVAVPFSEGEVSTWRASCDAERPLHGVGFLECVSIMKVLRSQFYCLPSHRTTAIPDISSHKSFP